MTPLDRVRETRTARDSAEDAFRQALTAAHAEHSLRELSEAAGLSMSGVRYLLEQEKTR